MKWSILFVRFLILSRVLGLEDDPLRGPECSSEDVDESVQLWLLGVLWATPAYLERERRARAPSVLDFQSGNFLFAEGDIAGPFLPN